MKQWCGLIWIDVITVIGIGMVQESACLDTSSSCGLLANALAGQTLMSLLIQGTGKGKVYLVRSAMKV